MNNSAVYIAIAGVLAAAAYILSTRNAEAEDTGTSSSGGAVNKGTGLAINNPGNIRFIEPPHNFNGQVGNSQGYGIYDSMANGVRAMAHVLTSYYDSGLVSIQQIVSKYAPASENPTSAYIASVSGEVKGNPYALNVKPTSTLVWPGDQLDLMMAMIFQENGYNPLSPSDVQAWINS